MDYLSTGATFDGTQLYRYTLSRRMSEGDKTMLVIGLNPSTATATEDDPTIRRCVGFALREGCNQYLMGNLFAYRSTQPEYLYSVIDPVGPQNDFWLKYMAKEADIIVAAWGAYPLAFERGKKVKELLASRTIYCLGKTKGGAPKHPLYLPKNTPLEEW